MEADLHHLLAFDHHRGAATSMMTMKMEKITSIRLRTVDLLSIQITST